MQTLVIGAGASGMIAALTAAAIPGNRVRVLERQARVGRKLSATGNGRCNLTNLNAVAADYHSGSGEDFHALNAFGVQETLQFFEQLGLVCVNEADGRCYPHSDQATSVVDVLRFALSRCGAQLELGCEVQNISCKKGRFHVKTSTGEFAADRLILATGGPACEKLGATADGARFVRMLGHSVTPLLPGLVQLIADEPLLRSLKGVRAPASLQLEQHGTPLTHSAGEVQFTENGVSGPAVFELSREASMNLPCTLTLDLLPQKDKESLLALLQNRRASQPELTTGDLLTGILHNRLGRVCTKKAGLAPATPLSTLSEDDLDRTAKTIKAFRLTITDTYGMENAQVTIGGANLSQFNPRTLESRIVPGLYACGEVLDVDGPCGGYNLQWAWSSGHLAGQLLHEEDEA